MKANWLTNEIFRILRLRDVLTKKLFRGAGKIEHSQLLELKGRSQNANIEFTLIEKIKIHTK